MNHINENERKDGGTKREREKNKKKKKCDASDIDLNGENETSVMDLSDTHTYIHIHFDVGYHFGVNGNSMFSGIKSKHFLELLSFFFWIFIYVAHTKSAKKRNNTVK